MRVCSALLAVALGSPLLSALAASLPLGRTLAPRSPRPEDDKKHLSAGSGAAIALGAATIPIMYGLYGTGKAAAYEAMGREALKGAENIKNLFVRPTVLVPEVPLMPSRFTEVEE